MATQVREIIHIDEDRCDGCGQCILSCAEGALQIIDGKAKLVSDNLCDGFGNCLGTCPQDAITIVRRKAERFDETAVRAHLTSTRREETPEASPRPASPIPVAAHVSSPGPRHHTGGCPGSAMRMFDAPGAPEVGQEKTTAETAASALTQWPVQLMLVPPTAPFLKGREILLAADCCPFAYADFHPRLLSGKALLVGCPKLDDLAHYRRKLEDIFRHSGCSGVTVVIMEVPCCAGLTAVAREAAQAAGRDIPVKEIIIGIQGTILRES